MSLTVHSPADSPPAVEFGVTVFGCERDEARMFDELAPEFGVLPTIIPAPVSEAGGRMLRGNACVSVSHTTPLPVPVLRALREAGVEYVSTRSIGLDHIDLAGAAELGITVGNASYPPDGVADFTVLLLLMALRDAPGVLARVDRQDFRLPRSRPRELRDLTVGVVGAGRIGRAVVDRLRGFGGRVLVCDPGRGGLPLDELLAESDVVSLHVPLLPETRHLLGPAQFERMRPGALVVNTSRGGVVDTAALVDALESGRLAGAALDVVEGETGVFSFDRGADPVDDPLLARLLELPNVIVTPHVAFATAGALRATVRATLEQCAAFERGRAR